MTLRVGIGFPVHGSRCICWASMGSPRLVGALVPPTPGSPDGDASDRDSQRGRQEDYSSLHQGTEGRAGFEA